MSTQQGLPQEGFVRLSGLIGGASPVVPLSRPTIWRKVNEGTFPAPTRFGKITAWPVDAIRAWLKEPK